MATRRKRRRPRSETDPAVRRRRVRPPSDAISEVLAVAWRLMIEIVADEVLTALRHGEIRADASDWTSRAKAKIAERLAAVETIVESVIRRVSSDVDANLRRIPGIDPKSLVGARRLNELRDENVSLIKDATEKQIATVRKVLTENSTLSRDALRAKIQETTGASKAKADLWARDQTLKLNAEITKERHLAAGISEYVWTTSGDERVRDFHDDLNGQTFSWDDPPVTNERGDRNHPGEDYQCRCIAYPVIDGPSLD